MYRAQLIEVTETTLYMKDGVVIEKPETKEKQLAHAIFGESKVMRTESVIERWTLKTKKEAQKRFWDWCEENKKDFRNYFVVFAEN